MRKAKKRHSNQSSKSKLSKSKLSRRIKRAGIIETKWRRGKEQRSIIKRGRGCWKPRRKKPRWRRSARSGGSRRLLIGRKVLFNTNKSRGWRIVQRKCYSVGCLKKLRTKIKPINGVVALLLIVLKMKFYWQTLNKMKFINIKIRG